MPRRRRWPGRPALALVARVARRRLAAHHPPPACPPTPPPAGPPACLPCPVCPPGPIAPVEASPQPTRISPASRRRIDSPWNGPTDPCPSIGGHPLLLEPIAMFRAPCAPAPDQAHQYERADEQRRNGRMKRQAQTVQLGPRQTHAGGCHDSEQQRTPRASARARGRDPSRPGPRATISKVHSYRWACGASHSVNKVALANSPRSSRGATPPSARPAQPRCSTTNSATAAP